MGVTRAVLVTAELLSALLAAVAVVMAWRRRAMTPAAMPFVVCQSLTVGWALAAGFGFAFPSRSASQVSELLSFVMSTSSGFFFVWFSLTLAGASRRRQWWARGVAFAVLAVTAMTAVSEPWHHLMYGPQWHGLRPLPPFGPLYLVFGAVASASVPVMIAVLVPLVRRGSATERRSAVLVLAGLVTSSIPTLVDAAIEGYPRRELIPIYLIAAGLLYLVAMLQSGMLGLVPLARHQVLERISDAVITVDVEGAVADANPAARRLLRAIGPLLPQTDGRHELTLTLGSGDRLDLQVTRDPLFDRRGHRVGAVLVARDVTELNEQTARLADSNARLRDQLATNSALRAELAELAVRDELTGLHNRRYLTGRMDEALLTAAQDGGPVSVVVFDVDHFKRVNDTFGHTAGDQVLRAIADVLADSTRTGDVISRHGGEEFVLLMPGCPEGAAVDRAEQLRRRIEQIAVPIGDRSLSLTVSAGVATVRPSPTGDPSERSVAGAALIAAADRALYRAKDAGRNLVLCADPAA